MSNGQGFYMVAGRVPFDDEDSAYAFEAISEDDAREQFGVQLYADRNEVWSEESEVYITAVGFSATPIGVSNFA